MRQALSIGGAATAEGWARRPPVPSADDTAYTREVTAALVDQLAR
ncbi:hypothetical protein [Micromonospora lupini]|nr:hypothetical protein [Micromonospora lupini]